MSEEEVCKYIGADSLHFLSVEGLIKSCSEGGWCCACFTGEYPVAIPEEFSQGRFLTGYRPYNLTKPPVGARMQIEEVIQEIHEEEQ